MAAGMTELAGWLEGQVADDHVDQARRELSSRGLTV
jgi:dTDP-L-rhamnose 4-epimerase